MTQKTHRISKQIGCTEFPATFPADFDDDTFFFCTALEAHNHLRRSEGLTYHSYDQLSYAEQRDVFERAQKLKDAARGQMDRPGVSPALWPAVLIASIPTVALALWCLHYFLR